MSILTVGPDETYSSIASAMTVANAGDQINIEAGYSNESAVLSVNNLFVNGGATSMNIDLTLGAGVDTVTLLGHAPIDVFDNSGNDTITGNAGANFVEVSGGIDVAHGGGGIDRLFVDYSDATGAITGTVVNITDGGGHAVTFDGFEDFTIYTGSGNDTITVGDGENIIRSGNGDDTVTAGNGPNTINGGNGNDTITAGDGGNNIAGDHGNDTITAGAGDDTINGGIGDDIITGGLGNDVLNGAAGNDTISGGDGDDVLIGDHGQNSLDGGTGTDTADYSLTGMNVTVNLSLTSAQAVDPAETDTLTSIENVIGSAGRDTLTGNAGNNVLTGGLGSDQLDGGGGFDSFAYGSVAESTSTTHDTIVGFDTLSDTFNLPTAVNAIDAEVSSGALTSGHFDANLASAIGSAQLSAHDAVLFAPDAGYFAGDTFLIVDANGQAGYQAGQDFVFQLSSSAHLDQLSATDFM